MRKAEKHCLDFAKKYPNQWHSFSKDTNTANVVKNLEIKQRLTVSWNTRQFMFDTRNNY